MAAPGRGSRSSLINHTFPSFYACYLLKSLQTPRSTATYIGSTPNPPRRLRQHNGELSAGATKTRLGRPWDMAMTVYGFPSKVAALQFEWAWQHPWKTRHLKAPPGDNGSGRRRAIFESGRGLFTLRARINVVRTMITSHPYSNWPLHVKLFNTEAVKAWEEAGRGDAPLPKGFTSVVELEGVDGKNTNMHAGSGRRGPIDVSDDLFTSAHLAAARALTSSSRTLPCSVCTTVIDIRTADPVTVCLCPTATCHSLAHISCLSEHFRDQDYLSPIIPRGGDCPTCKTWVSWGDIVKGMYRRQAGRAVEVEEDPDQEQDEDSDPALVETLDDGDMEAVLGRPIAPTTPARRGKGAVFAQTTAKRQPTRSKKGTANRQVRRNMPISQVNELKSDEEDFYTLLDAVGATSTDKDGVPSFQLNTPSASQPPQSSIKQPISRNRPWARVKAQGAGHNRGFATPSGSTSTQVQIISDSDEVEDFSLDLDKISDSSVEKWEK